MNKADAKILAPIMQAWGDGKTIQFSRRGDDYEDVKGTADFEENGVIWRIKPEPEVIWVNKARDCCGVIYEDREIAIKIAESTPLPFDYVGKKFIAAE